MHWVDFVQHNPCGAFFNLHLLHTLPDDHREIVLLKIGAVGKYYVDTLVPPPL